MCAADVVLENCNSKLLASKQRKYHEEKIDRTASEHKKLLKTGRHLNKHNSDTQINQELSISTLKRVPRFILFNLYT